MQTNRPPCRAHARKGNPASAKPTKLVSLAEAAIWASTSERTIRRRISDGSITGYRVGPRLIRVDLDELAALLRQIPTAG